MSEQEQPTPEHRRPDGVDDATVEALGKLSEALETVEDARGHLYGFHRLTGSADRALGEAIDLFRKAGHAKIADRLETELVGRNVVEGRWTFQIVEEFDRCYWEPVTAAEAHVREATMAGRRHVHEAEMKRDRQSQQDPSQDGAAS